MRRGSVSNWNPGDSLVIASAAPPSPQGAGEQSADATAAIGGDGGFPLPSKPAEDSAWCAVIEADQPEPVGDIRHLEHLLQTNQQAEGAMLFQTLTRLREALATQLTRDSDAEAPVMITAMDAVLLSRLLLKRLG